uniref:NADH-ubiquinone oxidoreductase chain 6 n=1 Tax=Nannophya pygmaea TaxID=229391 RepID=A0A384WMJ6_NANPY|nr:NADH dehydrogenase subunit 6 [Nannophya pygmaea]ATL58833.1 NADH dehydrogenase subunit 6 [Nannophya pygmaea]
MSQIFSVMLMTMNSLLFSSMSHPMNMGITLLMQTLLMCILTGMMSYSSWFSYILFLVFLGGMLVLFIYMTSIASNEMFKMNMFMMLSSGLFIMAIMMCMVIMDPFFMNNPITENFLINTKSSSMVMSPLYNTPGSYITVFMVLYLFLTLIVIVAITKSNKGPLRPMN